MQREPLVSIYNCNSTVPALLFSNENLVPQCAQFPLELKNVESEFRFSYESAKVL